MNELQLRSRLSDLADDLAPGDDPFELVADARALHRRRRRARMSVVGAALAVALVAVGVPTAINTLSAPDRGDLATPTTPTSTLPTEGPPGADEELAGVAENLGAALTRDGAATSVPDPEEGFPCPDATDALSRATGMYVLEPEGINAAGGTLTGCGWTSTGMDDRPEEQRMVFQLRAEFDTDTDRLLEVLRRRPRARLLVDHGAVARAADAARSARTAAWLIRLDEDGHGAWVLRAQTGEQVPESYGTKLGTLAELWHQVDLLDGADAPDPSPADDEPEITPMNREFNELAEAFARPARAGGPPGRRGMVVPGWDGGARAVLRNGTDRGPGPHVPAPAAGVLVDRGADADERLGAGGRPVDLHRLRARRGGTARQRLDSGWLRQHGHGRHLSVLRDPR